jgi:hypothetical protein
MARRVRTSLGSLAMAAAITLSPCGVFAQDSWQCVPFARLVSGIQIFGDARTWWSQAAGKYDTGYTPKAGAVLCFKPIGRMRLGHVAVVTQVLTDRVIQITHANWSLIDGDRGHVEKNVTVIDVSPAGDWSQVKDAANQVVAAVRPGASPLQMLNQAAESTDRIAALIQLATSQGAPEKK